MDSCRKKRKISPKLQVTEIKDRISNLPNDVTGRILSFVPTKYAVATGILSSRWRNLFQLSSKLDFDDSLLVNRQANSGNQLKNTLFSNFVSRVLVQTRTSQITSFCLNCGKYVTHSLLKLWIHAALFLHNVTEFEVSIELDTPYVIRLPDSSCQNLRVLQLGSNFILRVAKAFAFPNLKVLHFSGVTFPGSSTFLFPSAGENRFHGINGLLLGCPLLEELMIIGCNWNCRDLHFSNPLLRRLTLEVGIQGDLEQLNGASIYFNLPSLLYFKYSESLADCYIITNLNSVVDAHFDIGFYDEDYGDPQDLCDIMLDLIVGVSNCKFLYLSCQCLEALTSGDEWELPIFQNLTRLNLGQGYDVSWNDVLLDFLYCTPRLEDLTLVQYIGWNGDGQVDEDCSLEDHPVPICVSLHLKVFNIKEFTGLEGEIEMVMYSLENANVLEKMIIHWHRDQRARARVQKKILNLPKASEICYISFK